MCAAYFSAWAAERERERAQLKRTGTLYMVRFYNNDAWQ